MHIGTLKFQFEHATNPKMPFKYSELASSESFTPSLFKKMQQQDVDDLQNYKVKCIKAIDSPTTTILKFDAETT